MIGLLLAVHVRRIEIGLGLRYAPIHQTKRPGLTESTLTVRACLIERHSDCLHVQMCSMITMS
jgi:hypothetical protein